MSERWAEVYAQWTALREGGFSSGVAKRQLLRLDDDLATVAWEQEELSYNYMSWRAIAHPDGWLDVMNGGSAYVTAPGVKLRSFDGTLLWEWSHEDGEDYTMDAAVAADGSIYAVTTISDFTLNPAVVGFSVHRIDPASGVGVLIGKVWPADLPQQVWGGSSPIVEGTSIALSADGSVAYVLVTGETTWQEPGVQCLVGIDTATGALLWQKLLERERPGLYYATYNFYDSYDVRSVPGEDTCYVTYEAQVTDNEWRSQSLGRMEFPAGPRQAPTQAWTRLPFSVVETDEFSQWNGQRALVVTDDAVLIGVEQGYDTPAPARLILKYDHAGTLLWTWGEEEQIGENAAMTTNGLAVAAGVVFFAIEFGEETPLYPAATGLGALDYETGEFVGLGYFPVDAYYGGPLAARGEFVTPPGPEHCTPAPWVYPSKPCAPEVCRMEWDGGKTIWDAGDTWWACEDPPEATRDFFAYGINDNTNDFYLARHQPNGEHVWYHSASPYDDPAWEAADDALNAWPGFGGGSSTPFGYFVQRIGGGYLGGGAGFVQVDADGTPGSAVMVRPDSEVSWGQEVVSDAAGRHYATYYSQGAPEEVVIAAWEPSLVDMRWSLTNADLPFLDSDEGWTYKTAASLAMAPDGKTLVVRFTYGVICGIEAASGAVLWHHYEWPTAGERDDAYMMDQACRVAFGPQGQLLYNHEFHRLSSDDHGGVTSLHFPNGYGAQPLLAWRTDIAEPDDAPQMNGLAVLPDGSTVINYYGYIPGLARISAYGDIIWNRTLNDILAGTDGITDWSWDSPYSPLLLVGDLIVASPITGAPLYDYVLLAFDAETGDVAADASFTRIAGYWLIWGDLVRPDAAPQHDCCPPVTPTCPPPPSPLAPVDCAPSCGIEWDAGRTTWDDGRTAWDCSPPQPANGLVLGVGIAYNFARLNAETGEVLTYRTNEGNLTLKRAYISSGPGGAVSEFYVSTDGPGGDGHAMVKYHDGAVAWYRNLRPGGGYMGIPTADATADGAAVGVNLDSGAIGLFDAATGDAIHYTPLPTELLLSRDALLTPELDGMIVVRNRAPGRIARYDWAGNQMWQWANSGFVNRDKADIAHHDGFVYARTAGTKLGRFNVTTGEMDLAWSYTQSAMYGVALGRGLSAGKLFTTNEATVTQRDLETLVADWTSAALFGRIRYLVAGPDGEVYAATKDYQLQDMRMRVYRIESDGSVAWEVVLPRGLTTANDEGGLALSVGSLVADDLSAWPPDVGIM